jgi:hypothetical protein
VFVGDGDRDGPARAPDTDGAGGLEETGGSLLENLLVIGGIAAVVAVLAGLFWWNRRRRLRFVSPEAAWTGIVRLASRLGFGPRPSQTVYEYVGTLEGALPEVRPELREVAVARVETRYGRREPSGVRLNALRQAYRRVRRHLVLLILPNRRGR